jgi:hypothetical protein
MWFRQRKPAEKWGFLHVLATPDLKLRGGIDPHPGMIGGR